MRVLLILLSIGILTFLTSCNSDQRNKPNESADDFVVDEFNKRKPAPPPNNQAPNMILDISSPSKSATMATDPGNQSGQAYFATGETITFDFRRTTDDNDPVDNLSFNVTLKDEQGVITSSSGKVFTKSFSAASYYEVTVDISDTFGKKMTQQFFLTVHCAVPTVFNLNNSNINVTTGRFFNYWNFDLVNIASPGSAGPFKYTIDFNGDGMYDTAWTSTSTIIEEYVIFAGNRNVNVIVMDDTCKTQKSTSVAVDFSLPWEDGSVIPVIDINGGDGLREQYIFVQGLFAGINGNSGPEVDGAVLVTDVMGSDAPSGAVGDEKHATFDFSFDDTQPVGASAPATLKITGGWDYSKHKKSNKKFHGLHMEIDGIIAPTGFDAGATVLDTSAAKIKFISYSTDEDADVKATRTYEMNGPCNLELIMIASKGPGFCAVTGAENYFITINAGYSCDKLTSGTGVNALDVKVTEGEFFAYIAMVVPCPPGGGGGGGGGVPDIPQ